jgi:hypothetical protein
MRVVYVHRNGRIIPKSEAAPLNRGRFHVMPDIAPFVTQDGTEITSRSGLRAYEQAHGVKQVGNDFATFHQELRRKVHGDG